MASSSRRAAAWRAMALARNGTRSSWIGSMVLVMDGIVPPPFFHPSHTSAKSARTRTKPSGPLRG
ncbi:hypothetical protein [Sporomusa acidovorans]|uniref:hypothetical protein n=1 Tax=Sporomusa acidovorans TaxID=112900 RepID=UPI0011609F6F|nr:hypothetical protein [Sporomusa acidovorans]